MPDLAQIPPNSTSAHCNLYQHMADLDITKLNGTVAHDVRDDDAVRDDANNLVHHSASDLRRRSQLLLNEVEQFQNYLRDKGKEKKVNLNPIRSALQSEIKSIDKVVNDPSMVKGRLENAIRSSNLSFYNAVWSVAKISTDITTIRGAKRSLVNGARIDIVAEDGLEWVKVSATPEKRIIWDLTKAGWVGSDSEEESYDENAKDESKGLLKQVEKLVKASKNTRVKYRHPTVRLVLIRIPKTPDTKEVAQILQKIKSMGVVLQTSEDVQEMPLSQEILDRMCIDPLRSMTDVLNIDCSVLLSFISDLSHGQVEPRDWYNRDIMKQREWEAKEPFLSTHLWPVCGSRRLVCTREAALKMQEIVNRMGTKTERDRTALLLGVDECSGFTREQTLDKFQPLSNYTIPREWALPIEVVDVDIEAVKASLPSKMFESLSENNVSVLLYGWASRNTTISSNRTGAGKVAELGPDIWFLPCRSLVGKEKRKRGNLTGLEAKDGTE